MTSIILAGCLLAFIALCVAVMVENYRQKKHIDRMLAEMEALSAHRKP